MANTNRDSVGVKSLEKELKKVHMIIDVSNRTTHLYEAPTDAADASPCLLTRYQYSGATSIVTGVKEENSTWDSAWDF